MLKIGSIVNSLCVEVTDDHNTFIREDLLSFIQEFQLRKCEKLRLITDDNPSPKDIETLIQVGNLAIICSLHILENMNTFISLDVASYGKENIFICMVYIGTNRCENR